MWSWQQNEIEKKKETDCVLYVQGTYLAIHVLLNLL